MPKVFEDKIVWDADDWFAGFALQPGSERSQYLFSGAVTSQNIDPFRNPGHIGPGFSPSELLQIAQVSAVQLNVAAYVSGSKTSAFSCGGTQVHSINLDNDSISSDGIWPKSVAGATFYDIVTYRLGGAIGSDYAIASYYDGTDLEVLVFDINAAPADAMDAIYPTYWSVQLGLNSTDRNVPHPMAVGADGMLYIGDGNNLAKIDGSVASTTGSTSVLTLPHEYIISSFSVTEKYLIIYANKVSSFSGSNYYRGEAKAFFWDYVSANKNYTYDLDDNYVSAGFVWNGVPGCFTYGRGKGAFGALAGLRLFTENRFKLVAFYSGNPPKHGGVEIADDMIEWNSAGKVFSYGSAFPKIPASLNHRTSGSGSSEGTLKNLKSGTLYISSDSAGNGRFQKLSTSYNANASYQTEYAEPLVGPDEIAEATKIVTYFTKDVSGGLTTSLLLTRDLGAESNVTVLDGVGTTVAQGFSEYSHTKRMKTTIEKATDNSELPQFNALGLAITYTAGAAVTASPQYKKVEVYYKRVRREI